MSLQTYEYYTLTSFLSRKCKEHCLPMFGMQYDKFQTILTINSPVARILLKNQVPIMNIVFTSEGYAEIRKIVPLEMVEKQLQQKHLHPFLPLQEKDIYLHQLKELADIKAMGYKMLSYLFIFYDLTSVPEYATIYNIQGIPAFKSSVSPFEQMVASTTPDSELEKMFFVGPPYKLSYNGEMYKKPIFKGYVFDKKLGLRASKPQKL